MFEKIDLKEQRRKEEAAQGGFMIKIPFGQRLRLAMASLKLLKRDFQITANGGQIRFREIIESYRWAKVSPEIIENFISVNTTEIQKGVGSDGLQKLLLEHGTNR